MARSLAKGPACAEDAPIRSATARDNAAQEDFLLIIAAKFISSVSFISFFDRCESLEHIYWRRTPQAKPRVRPHFFVGRRGPAVFKQHWSAILSALAVYASKFLRDKWKNP